MAGYGDQPSDKVPANSTLYFLTTLNGIVRVTKAPLGGDCNEGQKARPNQDVTLRIAARVASPDGRGKKFLDKPSFEIRFGKPGAIRFVRGLETALTGACVEEKRQLLLGPNLAYGDEGKRDGSVRPGDSVTVDIEVRASKAPSRRLKFCNHGDCPTWAFPWLKAHTRTFTFKTLIGHYAKRTLTPQ